MSVQINKVTYTGGEVRVEFTAPADSDPTATCDGKAMAVAGDGKGNWTATLTVDLAPGSHKVDVTAAGKSQSAALEVPAP